MKEQKIILFDGVCNLCNASVNFLIKHDKRSTFSYLAMQSEQGKSLLLKLSLPIDRMDTIVYLSGSNVYIKSTAILKLFKELGGIWTIWYVFMIVPKPLRDCVYMFISKSRYSFFGKADTCALPPQ